MKKKLINKLKDVAAGLPVVMEMKPEQRTGAQLLEKDKGKDMHGKKIKKNEIYIGMTMQPVDHLTKLKAAYNRGGDDAVTEYSVQARRKHSEQKKQKAPEVNTI